MYTKANFGRELEKKLETTTDMVELARWAYSIYLENGNEFEDGLDEKVMDIAVMEEGPEFELSILELREIARNLQL